MAKRDAPLRTSGRLVRFRLEGMSFPTTPPTVALWRASELECRTHLSVASLALAPHPLVGASS